MMMVIAMAMNTTAMTATAVVVATMMVIAADKC